MLIAVCVLTLGCGASTSESSGGSTGPTGDGPADPNAAKDDPTNGGDGDGQTADGDQDANNGGDGKNTASTPDKGDPPVKLASREHKPEFPTTESPIKMSAFLEEPAREAFKKQRWPLAISYYSGLVAARGPASKEALELAYALAQEFQYQMALAVIDDFIANTDDPVELKKQREVRERVAQSDNPFSREYRPVHATKDALKSFKLGREAFKKKKYGDALLYFQIGSALDPDLAGFLRELGATYDKLGATQRKVEYLGAYLRRRPFGKNAEEARKLLAKNTKDAGRLEISSALPCDQVWLNAQLVPGKLPVKKLLVGTGRYTALCYSIKYDIAYFEEATIKAGESESIRFNWAIVVDGLVNPYGRIRIENVLDPGTFVAMPSNRPDGFGVVVPGDGRALQVQLTSLDRSRKETRYLKIAPGSKEVIKW